MKRIRVRAAHRSVGRWENKQGIIRAEGRGQPWAEGTGEDTVFYESSWPAYSEGIRGKNSFSWARRESLSGGSSAAGAGAAEGSDRTRDAELEHVGSGSKYPNLPLLPSCSLLRCLCWSDPTRNEFDPWTWVIMVHGGHPPGAQSRADGWSWAGGGGDANDKKTGTMMSGSWFQGQYPLIL